VLFWSFYPRCRLVCCSGFHSLLKYVDVTLPHSREECSPQSFSVSFPKVDSNSVKHQELMHLLRDSLLPLRSEEPEHGYLGCTASEKSTQPQDSCPVLDGTPPRSHTRLLSCKTLRPWQNYCWFCQEKLRTRLLSGTAMGSSIKAVWDLRLNF